MQILLEHFWLYSQNVKYLRFSTVLFFSSCGSTSLSYIYESLITKSLNRKQWVNLDFWWIFSWCRRRPGMWGSQRSHGACLQLSFFHLCVEQFQDKGAGKQTAGSRTHLKVVTWATYRRRRKGAGPQFIPGCSCWGEIPHLADTQEVPASASFTLCGTRLWLIQLHNRGESESSFSSLRAVASEFHVWCEPVPVCVWRLFFSRQKLRRRKRWRWRRTRRSRAPRRWMWSSSGKGKEKLIWGQTTTHNQAGLRLPAKIPFSTPLDLNWISLWSINHHKPH